MTEHAAPPSTTGEKGTWGTVAAAGQPDCDGNKNNNMKRSYHYDFENGGKKEVDSKSLPFLGRLETVFFVRWKFGRRILSFHTSGLPSLPSAGTQSQDGERFGCGCPGGAIEGQQQHLSIIHPSTSFPDVHPISLSVCKTPIETYLLHCHQRPVFGQQQQQQQQQHQ